MLIRRTGFNPFRLAAAIASCSPPSPASRNGSYDDRAPARHLILSFCAHTQRITEFAAKPRDFRMERHVLGSGRSVSGRRRGSPRRLRNVTLRRKAALFASEMTKNISNEFQKEIRLKIFRNKGFSRLTEAPDGRKEKIDGRERRSGRQQAREFTTVAEQAIARGGVNDRARSRHQRRYMPSITPPPRQREPI